MLENPGQSNHDLRVTAFIAYMEKNYPDMKLVGRQASNQDSNKAYQAMLGHAPGQPEPRRALDPGGRLGRRRGRRPSSRRGAKVMIMHADVTPTTLEHIKAGNIHMALNPNQGIQGYVGFLATFLAAHPDLIDPFNDYKRVRLQPDGIPFIDNGFAVITKDNADDFDLERLHGRPLVRGLTKARRHARRTLAAGRPRPAVTGGPAGAEVAADVRRDRSSR